MKSRPISLKKVENCFLLFKKFVVEYDTGDKDFKLWVTRLFYETICGFGKNNLDNIKTVNYLDMINEAADSGEKKPAPSNDHLFLPQTASRYFLENSEKFLNDFELFYDYCVYLDKVIHTTRKEGNLLSQFSKRRNGYGMVKKDPIERYKYLFEKGEIKFYMDKKGYQTEFPKSIDYFDGISKEHHKNFWKKYTISADEVV